MRTKGNGAAAPGKERRSAVEDKREYAAPTGERRVREIVRDELRRLLSRAFVDERCYSTRTGCGPEGYSRDANRDLGRRIGRRRGRYYYFTQAELDAHERGHEVPQAPPTVAPAWHPSDAARALGLRVVGRSR